MNKDITVYNLGNLPVAPLDSFRELQEDFKLSDPAGLQKLQMLILTRGFKYAFKAWKDPSGTLWIIDAHQRRRALLPLRRQGFNVPPIPYEPIFAGTKKEAVEEIAAYNSEFAKRNPDTLLFRKYEIDRDTLERFSLSFEPVALTVPTLSGAESFAPGAGMEDVCETPAEDAPSQEAKDCITLPGDIWLLDDNRLMAGDSLDHRAVARLMDGRRADICVTDPPYNVAYEGGTEEHLTISNDSMEEDRFTLFLTRAFSNMFSHMKEGAPFYIFYASSAAISFYAALRQTGLKASQQCIWIKNGFVLGRHDYHYQHEPVIYGWKPGAAHPWHSDRSQTTLWRFDKPQRSAIHPTMKPLRLMAYPITNSSSTGDTVLDIFSGSASTLMAAQQTGRICYAMEISPFYVDASVRRYISCFGREGVRLLRDGREFSPGEIALPA